MKSFAYIDAANLFYGGRKSLGWSIDYEKLRAYLSEKYQIEHAYFFGGVEIHKFPFDVRGAKVRANFRIAGGSAARKPRKCSVWG